MKRQLYGRPAALLALLALALAGCGRLAAPAGAGPAGTGSLEIVVENLDTGPLRTIAPAPLTGADLADTSRYTLRLTGTAGRRPLPERTVTLTNGRATLGDMPDGTWSLTLTAYDSAGATALMSGHATVTVRGPGAEARFTLTPVAGGTGTVSLSVSWQAADRDFVQPVTTPYPSGLTVSMALYDPVTGQKATSYERLASGGNGAQSDTDAFFRRGFIGTGSGGSTTLLATTFTYTGGTSGAKTYNVPAGMYMLKFTITGGNLPAGQRLEWSDLLYVEAGRQTTGAVTIPRLSGGAAAPAGFAGQTTAMAAGGSYTATLSWDRVHNAGGYELQLLGYASGTALPRDDAAWAAAVAAAGAVVHEYNCIPGDPDSYTAVAAGRPAVTAGGLLGGSDTISLAMAASSGRSCTARLRSVSAMGSSGWVYLGVPLVPAPAAPALLEADCSFIGTAGGTFPVTLSWEGGYVDAGGTWELQVLSFTGGTKPTDDAAWGNATGRAEHTLTSTAAQAGPVAVTGGSLAPGSDAATLALNDTASYYTARIRGRNSSGEVSRWVYHREVMIPMPTIETHTSTRLYHGQTNQGMREVWDVTLQILSPQASTSLELGWIRQVVGLQDNEVMEDDADWSYLSGLALNSGSNSGTVSGKGQVSHRLQKMNKDSGFIFRLRTRTPYGDSPWFYYRDTVRQAP